MTVESTMTESQTTEDPFSGSEGQAYQGRAGQTWLEPVHVRDQGGGMRVVELHRVVNVMSDPPLRERTLAGDLHRLPSGELLAIPFVYHDPASQVFALVLPETLLHEELRERARLLSQLAEDTAHPVPDYVRHFHVAVGVAGLATHLDEVAAGGPRGSDGLLEERLSSVNSREADLRAFGEQLTGLRRQLELRDRALARRAEELDEREAALLQREQMSGHTQVGDLDVELLDEDSDPELVGAVELVDDDEAELISDAVEELVGDEDVEEVTDAAASNGLSGAPLSSVPPPVPASEETTAVREYPSSLPLQPPARFLDDPYQQMTLVEGDDGPWLFVRVEEGHEDAFKGGTSTCALLPQLVRVEQRPVLVLSLVDDSEERPYVRRTALDPSDSGDQAALQRLAEDFAAGIAVFSPLGRSLRSFELRQPERAPNLRLALSRVSEIEVEPSLDAAIAMERALEVPPPTQDSRHPFRAGELKTDDAAHTMAAVALLADWAAGEPLDHVLLVLSVPKERVDAVFRRVLEAALEQGVALSGALADRAIAQGLARDAGELADELAAAFARTCASPGRGGLGDDEVAINWRRLLDLAAESEVSLSAELCEAAWEAMRKAGTDAPAPPEAKALSETKLAEVGIPELLLMLEHPKSRLPAAKELCRRQDGPTLTRLYGAVRKMPREEVLEVMPSFLTVGDAAADALIDGLRAKKTFVRQASAIGLAKLGLRRAVSPLVSCLADEPSDVWRELARVLARFDEASLDPLVRAAPRLSDERLAYAFACMAEAGFANKIEELRSDSNPRVSEAALKALTLRDVVKAHTSEVLGSAEPPKDDLVRSFSRSLEGRLGGAGA